jgi:hypothetical protein
MPRPFTAGHPHWWQWLTVLSLDAPLVAVLWQTAFARVLGVRSEWQDPVLLGLAVWMVYAADRWIEGWRLAPERVRTQRHYFYIRWRWPVFSLGLGLLGVATVIAVTRLQEREFKAGLLLLIPTLVYLFSHQLVHRHHPLRVPKEICIAVIFTLGCALAPAVRDPGKIHLLPVPATLFGLLCFTNCALIAAWEKEVDTLHGQTSLALQWHRGFVLIHTLPWLLFAAGIAARFFGPAAIHPFALCTIASAFLLGVLDYIHPLIGREAARAAVDVTLMTPVIFVFV